MPREMPGVRCSACGGAVERGVLRDSRGIGGGAAQAATWIPTFPRKEGSAWTEPLNGLDTREEIPVQARRCLACGHLDFFAPG